MKASLTIISGRNEGLVFDVSLPGVRRIGRSHDNEIHISDSSVSRIHAVLENDGQFHWLSDHESANGTFVNKTRITKYMLHDGDHIRIGRVKLAFRVGSAPAPELAE